MSVCTLIWHTPAGTQTAETDGRTLAEAKARARDLLRQYIAARAETRQLELLTELESKAL